VQNQLLKLTPQTIGADIAVYRQRQQKVQDKLDALPAMGSSPCETRKIKVTRHRLEAEVAHVLGLIRLAAGALVELEQVRECIN
jgi:hypothetical protein